MARPDITLVNDVFHAPKLKRQIRPDWATLSKFKVNEVSERNSTESPLLRLPAELRNQIYGYAVGGQTYDISSRGYAVGSVPHLHLVCRQIYNEASTLPFSLNVFSSRTPFSLSHFILPLSSSQRDAIRTIQFVLTGKMGASHELWTNDPASAGHASILEGLQTVLIVWICRKRSLGAEEEEIRELQRVVGFWRAGITVRKSE